MRWIGLLFCWFFVGFAQNTTLKLCDYHSSQITSIIATPDGKNLLTADQSGKILLSDLSTLTFIKTIKASDGFSIDNLQLLGTKGAVLYTSKDSIFYLDYKQGHFLGKSPFKGKVLHQNNPRFKLFTQQTDRYSNTLVVVDLDTNKTIPINTEDQAITATVTQTGDHVIYVAEKGPLHPQKLICIRLSDQQLVWEQLLDSNDKIIHIFNSTAHTAFDAVTFSESTDALAIYRFTDKNRVTQPQLTIPFPSTRSTTTVTDYFSTDNLLIVTSSLQSLYPVVITFDKENFAFNRCAVDQTYSAVFYNQEKKELLFPNNLTHYPEGIATITVFNLPTLRVNKIHPPSNSNFYVGAFLPQDNWMVYGNSSTDTSTQFKYYTQGTFFNRFAQFSCSDYLQQKFALKSPIGSKNFIDFLNGKLLFFEADYTTNKNYIYKYNLIEDHLELAADLSTNYLPTILDYNDKANLMLVSKELYNPNYSNPQEVTLIKEQSLYKLPGNYKAVKISNNGKYILTISEQDIIEIFNSDRKSIFKQEVFPGFYTVFSIDETGFIIANSHQKYSLEKCRKETLILATDPLENYSTKTLDCAYATHVTSKNGKLALFIENIGLLIDQKRVPIYFTQPPKALSFNTDASKLMISFAEGKIGIYDTTTFEELGAMFHPSKKEHIFYSANGFYFSNTNAQHFIQATRQNLILDLERVDPDVFNPKEVLALMGKPNEEYTAILEKAIALRKSKKELDLDAIESSQKSFLSNPTDTTKKANLYVLTVGVSDYQQKEYDLTFADKDALDIADLYGSLTPSDSVFYKQKFYGKKYTLHNQKSDSTYSLKKYLGEYGTVGKLFPIQSNSTQWLELKDHQAFIWDFKKETIEPITLPEGFTYDSWGLKKTVLCHPHSDAFYLCDSNNTYYQYNALKRSFDKIILPFDLKEPYGSVNIEPLNNNRWIYFEAFQNGTCLVKIGSHSSSTSALYHFDLKKYYDLNHHLQNDEYVYNPTFKCVTNEGTQLIYTVNEKTFLINLNESSIPIQLPIPIAYSDEVALSHDSTVRILHDTNGKYHNTLTTFNLTGKPIATTIFEEDSINIKGITIIDSNPNWIIETNGLLESNILKTDHNLAKFHPHSFNQVKVMSLINEQATSQSIKNQFVTFFKESKPEDQVVVFLAGHGVLDSKNHYYYAPHDMNFYQVAEKGVGFELIVERLKQIPAKHKLLLMDSCHSGNTLDLSENVPVQNEKTVSKGQRGSISKGIKKDKIFKLSEVVHSVFDNFLSTSGITILSASSGSDVAYENQELGNGAFTTAYLKVLENKLGAIIITEKNSQQEVLLTDTIISEIMKEVTRITQGKQLPDVREFNTSTSLKLW